MIVKKKYLIPGPLDMAFTRKTTAHIQFLQERPAIYIVHQNDFNHEGQPAGHGYLLRTIGCSTDTEADRDETVIIPHGMWQSLCTLAKKPPIEVQTTCYATDKDAGYTLMTETFCLPEDSPETEVPYRTIATVNYWSETGKGILPLPAILYHIPIFDITDDRAYDLVNLWANQEFPKHT